MLDKILLLFLLTILIQAIQGCVFRNCTEERRIYTVLPFGLLYGPLAYFVYCAACNTTILRRIYYFHLIPFFLAVTIYFIFISKRRFFGAYDMFYAIFLYGMTGISWAVYTVVFLFRILQVSHWLDRLYKYGMLVFASLFALMLPLAMLKIANRNDDGATIDMIMATFMFLGVAAVYLYFVRNMLVRKEFLESKILEKKSEEEMLRFPEVKEIPSVIKIKIDAYLQEGKYLEPEFKQETMVKDLQLPKSTIAQYFVQYHDETFSKCINSMRIVHACRLLLHEQLDYSMEELAAQCGFNSRASFYRNFSREMGCTPLTYREVKLKKNNP
ncbi:helix-turn-helix domain-containing protein [Sphingobacterium sp. LRF_L2]|uniref:AraC family transcriptional regulator n=1 Tax=Sphingobacterium sp. LRF_L2 TaxID=3369421 RepID=UPI003F609C4D